MTRNEKNQQGKEEKFKPIPSLREIIGNCPEPQKSLPSEIRRKEKGVLPLTIRRELDALHAKVERMREEDRERRRKLFGINQAPLAGSDLRLTSGVAT